MSDSRAARVTVTVAVPSVGREAVLANSLNAIRRQSDSPDDLIVVAQSWDSATQLVAGQYGARLVLVEKAGLAVAVETAIGEARTDVIAFVDDDAVAFPDWVGSIRKAFSDNIRLGLLGGRDNVAGEQATGHPDLIVGRFLRGKIYGNHHIGTGHPRSADHVKGANMSMRVVPAKRIPLGTLVSGDGAQVRNEFILSLGITSQGYEGFYDPAVQVDHFPATRATGDERTRYSRDRTKLLRHNETVAISLYRSGPELWLYIIRSLAIGDRIYYGVAHLLTSVLKGQEGAFQRFAGSAEGILSGLKAARQMRGMKFSSAQS